MWLGCCVRTSLAWGMCSVLAAAIAAQQTEEKYELRGKVVNLTTGAPVANALVRLGGSGDQVHFSAADGAFVFTELSRGNYQLTAAKPGYFNAAELGQAYSGPPESQSVPADTDAVLKLTPEGIIYGTVENESGQPIEELSVRVQTWQISNGVKQLGVVGTATTDDEGQFRVAELRPGNYFVNFFSGGRGGFRVFSGGLPKKVQDEQGYGSQYYPGVPDVASATLVRIRAGSQGQITQKLKQQKLYDISGVVHGASPEAGFHISLSDDDGERVQETVHEDQKTGEFQIAGVPEGTYLLTAIAQDLANLPGEPKRPLMATLPVHVNTDLTGLVLMLGRGANVDVSIEDEIPLHGEEIHQVTVSLASKGFHGMWLSHGLMLPPPPGAAQVPRRFEGIAPGIYEVEAAPNGRGYVASLRCGDVDLMRDDLTVTAGATVPPIEVTLRDDGASISVQTTDNGQPASANVLLYSEEYPKKSIVLGPNQGNAQMDNIRPGVYKVVALKGLREAEFRDAEFMQKYLVQAKEVNLRPGDKVTVQVEVQAREEE